VRKTIASYGAEKINIFDKERALKVIGGIEPISIENVSYPVKRSLRRVRMNFFR